MKVFTNGCFDILHRGHLELLEYCSKLACPTGNCVVPPCWVVVGLNSDDSIRRLKGKGRPINNQDDRKFFLESLSFVDEVKLFDEDTPYELIKSILPDIIVKGGDYKPDEVIGNYLCEVKIFDFVDGYSTTKIIQNLRG
jgi:D-beta-D-heptose 7-phosphate kinase/D-beta-D-heptose 1-phosphate adenosyltransferase